MKRGFLLFLSILVLALTPVMAPAQGFLGGMLPSIPGLPSFGGGGGSCDSAVASPFIVSGRVGYNYETVDLSFATLETALQGIGAIDHTFRFSGLELGCTAMAISRTGFGGLVSFKILATGTTKDTEDYNQGQPGLVAMSRHWDAKNDTYAFDGVGFYEVFSGSYLIGGFRWDHLETTYERPTGTIAVAGLPTDEAVLTTNVYQPYIGVMVDQGGPSRFLRVGMVGFPFAFGSVKYEQTLGAAAPALRIDGLSSKVDKGYFFEIWGEYGLRENMFMGAGLSVFASWTQYHVKGEWDADANAVGLGNIDSDLFNLSLHRNSFTVGGRLEVPIEVPMPFSF